jgi:flagellar P-ring protein precursor FlgI
VSVLHGGLQIQVDTVVSATQAAPGSDAAPAVVTNTAVHVQDKEASSIHLENGADVEELVKGLHTIGATSHDIVSILEAIKAAGGLQADLEVI